MAALHTHKTITWHMIGHVQRRKARLVAADFDWVHSLDGLPLAERLGKSAAEAGKALPVLLECNVSGEASKEGLEASIWRQTQPNGRHSVAQWRHFGPTGVAGGGLMTMAPIVPA